MTGRSYTIGEAARLSGVSVRTLRYYSDEGLLPPAARTEGGYRVYTDADLVRLDLIRTLRRAGCGLDEIRSVLARELPLGTVLQLRLQTLEAEIAAQRRVAGALRAALRSPHPTEDDLRRIWTMTSLSQAERRAVIARFYDAVSEGTTMDPDWKRRAVEASTPELPDEPTPKQIDAWIEMSEIVSDPSFIEAMRRNAREVWTADFDSAAYASGSASILAKARAAIADGVEPGSTTGGEVAREWLAASAAAMHRKPDEAFKTYLREQYAQHDPRAARYWELVNILRGEESQDASAREWGWIIAAMKHHLA